MPRMIFLPVVAVACAAAAACGSAPTTPRAPAVEACERLSYATYELVNASQRSTYDIYINGARVFQNVTPGTMGTGPLAAGVSHTFVFRYAGTSINACSPTTIIPIACVKERWECKADR